MRRSMDCSGAFVLGWDGGKPGSKEGQEGKYGQRTMARREKTSTKE
jgi:hypothetical protein